MLNAWTTQGAKPSWYADLLEHIVPEYKVVELVIEADAPLADEAPTVRWAGASLTLVLAATDGTTQQLFADVDESVAEGAYTIAALAVHGADGRLERAYRAIVWGVLPRPRGAIDAALARSSSNRTKIAVVAEERGRRATTHYEVLERYGAVASKANAQPVASLLRLVLETGRTHQIRVHLAHIGHPLLGDMT